MHVYADPLLFKVGVCVCAMPCADALMVVCVSAFTSIIYESFDTVLLHSTMAREHGVQVFAYQQEGPSLLRHQQHKI